jgi:hypothetical protein
MANYKAPRSIEVADSLSISGAGKILKRERSTTLPPARDTGAGEWVPAPSGRWAALTAAG